MSRSRGKTSSRRQSSAKRQQAAAPQGMPFHAESCPEKRTGQGGGVSRTVCLLCCLVCLLAGGLLGNLLPDMLESVSARGPNPAASGVSAPAVPLPAGGESSPVAPSAVPDGPRDGQATAPVAEPTGANPELRHIAHLEQELRQHPDDVARWIALGNACFDTRQPLKAIEAYGRALKLQPNNPDVLTDLGIMYRENGQYELALDCFDKAVALKPSHEQARFNKGVVLLFDLHRHAEAKAAWQELLGINPRAVAPDGTSLHDLIRQCDKPLP